MLALAAQLPLADAAANGCAPGLPASFCHQHSTTSCVARNELFCSGWAADNFHRYVGPLLKQLLLVSVSVAAGFAIAFALAVFAHRRHWMLAPLNTVTGVLYTVPALAFFALLLPITGLGTETAVIVLTAYTLQIIYRNITAGLANVPPEARDAGRGMGMTDRQLLWRVELPLAVPEIVAGLRIATVSTVAIATLAAYAGGGGLGELIFQDLTFKTNLVLAGGLAIGMAIVLDILLLVAQRLATPWLRARPA
jgi:osmoprotectant transport system permease protein